MGLLTGVRCSAHPDDAAQRACARCGDKTCAQCAASTGLCARCAVEGAAPASARAARARTLAFLALPSTVVGLLAVMRVVPVSAAGLWPLGFLCGIAGLVLSVLELSAISRGASPASGRRLVMAALGVSVAHAGMLFLFFVAVFVVGFSKGFSRH